MRLRGEPLHVGWRCPESTSSIYACNPPEGPSNDVPTIAGKPLSIFHPHRVTSLMTRLHGYVFEMSIFGSLVTQRQLPRGLFQSPHCSLTYSDWGVGVPPPSW